MRIANQSGTTISDINSTPHTNLSHSALVLYNIDAQERPRLRPVSYHIGRLRSQPAVYFYLLWTTLTVQSQRRRD